MKGSDPIALATLLAGGLGAVSVAWASGPLVWRALGYDPMRVEPVQPAEPARPTVLPDISRIIAFAPFGAPATPVVPQAGVSADGLVLHGVVLASPIDRSRALVSRAREPMRPYSIGDRLPGGAILREIFRDHVMIDAGQGEQRLPFPVPGVSSLAANVISLGAQNSGSLDVSAPADRRAQIEETIDLYRQKIRDDPQALAREYDVAPIGEGYQIGRAPHDRLARAGLRPGDVVLSINGQPVGDIERDRGRFEELAAGDRLRVEVRRGDRVLVLSFPIR